MFSKPLPLSESHIVDDFDCGKPSLNDFLILTALSNQRANYSSTHVTADTEYRVAGYFSLCASMISRETAPKNVGGHGAPREIPVVLLARLAVDRRHHGKGLGALLLGSALAAVAVASENIGVRAVMVHAIDDQAAQFYRRYGFRNTKNNDRTLLLTRSELELASSVMLSKK